jgi:bifunctional non-homologous end joining protein LigD
LRTDKDACEIEFEAKGLDVSNDTKTIKINNHTIILSHEDKIMFPNNSPKHDHITKHDIIEYYRKIAKWMVPHMKNRPVSMLRLPEGLKGESFYQKDIPESFPAWIKCISIPKEGGYNRMVVCNNAATLVYLANQCCITPHLWLSCCEKLNYPNRMIFDLDPSRDNDFTQICNAALKLKEILESIGLIPFVMTTGSRGLHVVVPLARNLNKNGDFDTARAFAREIAEQLVSVDPKHLTTQIRKNKRHGRIYVDVGRNAYAQTSVAPYAVRAKPLAPVATPLLWKELLDKKLTAQRYNIKNIFKRLDQNGDPWKDINLSARYLKSAKAKFEKLYKKSVD